MSVLLIGFVILLYTMQSFLCKKYTLHYPGDPQMAAPVFTVVSGLIVAVSAFAFSGFRFQPHPLTLLLGFINIAAILVYNFAIVKCSQKGPFSVMTVFNLGGGILIPSLVAHIFFKETLSPLQGVSMAVVLVSMYLMSVNGKQKSTGTSLSFLVYCLVLCGANGVYCTVLDVQQRLTGAGDKEELVTVTFLGGALVSLLMLIFQKKGDTFTLFRQNKKSAVYLLTCSAVAALAITVLTVLLGYLDTALLYTFENSGVLLLSVLFGRLFFKEKLSPVNIFGCVLMAFGLVGISIF